MREMLRKLTPLEMLALPDHELERAILIAMVERGSTKGGGMANKFQPAAEAINHLASSDPNMPFHERRPIQEDLERRFRRAFQSLEQKSLVEPASGINGENGYVVLTKEGQEAARNPLNLDTIHMRNMLKPDLLHPKLRGKPYKDFANGEPTSAIQEAFKIVEIEVRAASGMLQGHGQNLMQDAFDHQKGPLTDHNENETTRKALPKLFAGAMGRFRNPSTHTQRSFPDLLEAIEELMVASRLLRFLDEAGRQQKP